MSRIQLNGKTYNIPDAKNVLIKDGQVFVDGKPYLDDADAAQLARSELVIRWDGPPIEQLKVLSRTSKVYCGDVGTLEANGSVEARDVSGDIYAKGSVNCSNVSGNIKSDGSINCGNVGGDIKAGGSLTCGTIGGNAKDKCLS